MDDNLRAKWRSVMSVKISLSKEISGLISSKKFAKLGTRDVFER